jgi:hypothetical protein
MTDLRAICGVSVNKELAEADDGADFLTVLERYLDATDPRDRVYGLLWALDELNLPLPNYLKSVAQVYEEATVAIIHIFGASTSSLNLLYCK